MFDSFADLMIEKIKTIQGDWKQPWFSPSFANPRNMYDGKPYDGVSSFMLSLHSERQGYEVPVFGTYNRILSLNYDITSDGKRHQLLGEDGEPLPMLHVKKGEAGFPLFFTSFTIVDKDTRKKVDLDFNDYKQLSRDEQEKYKVFPKRHIYTVFAVDQTNMREARPEMYEKWASMYSTERAAVTDNFKSPLLDKIIDDNAWLCSITHKDPSGAYFSPSKDYINVPEKSLFRDAPEQYYGTTLHEMIHSTGTKDRLDRLVSGSVFGSADYAREELVAELGSAFVCQQYGIEKNIKEESAKYLKSWLGSLEEEPEFIRTVLTDVKKATGMVNEELRKIKLDPNVSLDSGTAALDDIESTMRDISQKHGLEQEKEEALEPAHRGRGI